VNPVFSIFSGSSERSIQFPALADQSTDSVLRFLEDTQQGYLSSVGDSDFKLGANLQFFKWGQSH